MVSAAGLPKISPRIFFMRHSYHFLPLAGVWLLSLSGCDLLAQQSPIVPAPGLSQFYAPGAAPKILVPHKAGAAVTWRLLDFDGKEIDSGQVQEKSAAAKPIGATGFYRMAFLDGEGKELGHSGLIVQNAPGYQSSKIGLDVSPSRFWGNEVTRAVAGLIKNSNLAQRVRVQQWWWMNQPSRDVFKKSPLNEVNEVLSSEGMNLNMVGVETTGWAARDGKPGHVFPENLRDIYNFYIWSAKNWPAGMSLLEVWNEPDIMGWATGSRAASLAKAVSLAVRSVRPDVKITTPSPATSTLENYFAEMLANDLQPYVDAYAMHHHVDGLKKAGAIKDGVQVRTMTAALEPTMHPADPDRTNAILEQEDTLDYMYQRYATHAQYVKGLPVYNMEGGLVDPKDGWACEKEQAEGLVAYLAIDFHLGVTYHQYYCIRPSPGSDSDRFNLLNAERNLWDVSPRAGWQTLNVFAEKIGSAIPMGRLSIDGVSSSRVVFFDPKKDEENNVVAVFWDAYQNIGKLPFSRDGVRIFDCTGRDITDQPDAGVITWPPKYAVLPKKTAKALTLKKEAVFPAVKTPTKPPSPIVLDLSLPESRYTTRPLSGIKVSSGTNELPLRVHNFSDVPQTVRLEAEGKGVKINLEPESVELAPQTDAIVTVRLVPEPGYASQKNAFAPQRQTVRAVAAKKSKSVLAFNTYAEFASLPVASAWPIEGMKDEKQWWQAKWDEGKPVLTAVEGGMRVGFTFPKAEGQATAFIRCKIQPPGLNGETPDALAFDLTLHEGNGYFQASLIDSNDRHWHLRFARIGQKNETTRVIIPLKYLDGPGPFKPGDVTDFSLGATGVPRTGLDITVSKPEWIKFQ